MKGLTLAARRFYVQSNVISFFVCISYCLESDNAQSSRFARTDDESEVKLCANGLKSEIPAFRKLWHGHARQLLDDHSKTRSVLGCFLYVQRGKFPQYHITHRELFCCDTGTGLEPMPNYSNGYRFKSFPNHNVCSKVFLSLQSPRSLLFFRSP